jgi:tetratricopeptide (TPR) repeat protein
LEKVRETARTHDRIGDAFRDSGQMVEALTHFEEEVKAWRQVVEAAPSSAAELTGDCASLAEALMSSGDTRQAMGDAKPALDELDDALDITYGLLFGARSAPEVCRLRPDAMAPYPNPRALLVASEALGSRFSVSSDFHDDGNAAAGLAMAAARLMPGSLPAGRNLIVALSLQGRGQTGRDAVEAYEKGTTRAGEWSHWDPNSKMAQRELAAAQLLAVGGTVDCYRSKSCTCPANDKTCEPASSLNETEATALGALATLRALAQSDPSNSLWRSDEASAWQTYAKVLSARGQGRNSERLKALEEAEKVDRDLKERLVGDAEFMESFALLLVDIADASKDLDQLEHANRSLEEATGVFKDLVAAHPDNDTYKDDLSFAFGRQSDMLRKVDKTGADDAKRKQNEIAKTARVVYREYTKQLNDARTHFQQGKKLKQAEQYRDAIKEFELWETSYLRHVRYGSKNDDFEHLYEAYGLIAETQEKLGNVSEQEAALNRSMHAAEIAVAIDPDKDGPRETLLAARFKLVRVHTRNWTTNFDEPALAVARESVADAESLLARHRQNTEFLTVRGMSRLALGLILRGRKEISWQEAIRSSVIDEEFVAGKDKQDKDSLKYAGGGPELRSHWISRSKARRGRPVTNCSALSRTIGTRGNGTRRTRRP